MGRWGEKMVRRRGKVRPSARVKVIVHADILQSTGQADRKSMTKPRCVGKKQAVSKRFLSSPARKICWQVRWSRRTQGRRQRKADELFRGEAGDEDAGRRGGRPARGQVLKIVVVWRGQPRRETAGPIIPHASAADDRKQGKSAKCIRLMSGLYACRFVVLFSGAGMRRAETRLVGSGVVFGPEGCGAEKQRRPSQVGREMHCQLIKFTACSAACLHAQPSMSQMTPFACDRGLSQNRVVHCVAFSHVPFLGGIVPVGNGGGSRCSGLDWR